MKTLANLVLLLMSAATAATAAADTVRIEWEPNKLLLLNRDMELVAGYYIYWEESGDTTPAAWANKVDVGLTKTWQTSEWVAGRQYRMEVAAYAAAAPEWVVGHLTVTMPETPSEPARQRLVRITVETSTDFQTWEPLAIILRVALPADRAFIRTKMELVEPEP